MKVVAASDPALFELIDRRWNCLPSLDEARALVVADAGTVFVGNMTPLVCGEYLAGTSSLNPAAGTTCFASSLSLSDYTRSFGFVENTLGRMENDAAAITVLAEHDGLAHHAQTSRMRFGS